MNPYIIDTTLRDGEQSPGVVFSIDEKLKVASLLDELGVNEVEAGTPAIGTDEKTAIKEIASAGFSFCTSSWCRANLKDIREAAELGTQSINISLPVSDLQIETLGKSREWVLNELKKMVAYAKGCFPHVTMGAQDATRAQPEFLDEFIFYASDAGADRIRIADTVGLCDPIEINKLFSRLIKTFPYVQFEFHGHNDFGMATANAVSAINAGVQCVSATVNGLGERAGNSVLEELVAYLASKRNNSQFNTKVLTELSNYLATISGKTLPENKPITGASAYKHESGIHTSAILKNKKSYQILNPEDFGAQLTSIVFGKHSGSASIMQFFKERNLYIDKELALDILKNIKEIISSNSKPITEQVLMHVYQQVTQTKTYEDTEFF